MAAFAIFCRVLLLILNAAAILHRRLLPALRRRRLLCDAAAIFMVLGASTIFHAVAGPNDDTHALAAAGFLIWMAGVALLLLALTPGRFPGAAAPTFAILMAAFAIFYRVLLLVLNTAAILLHRLLVPPLHRRRLHRYDAAILSMVLGASALFHAVAAGPNDATEASRTLAAAGFLIWVAGVALLLFALTVGRFPGPGAAAPARLAAQLVAVGALF